MPLKMGEVRGPFTLRMCLFGGKIRWMENFKEKMRRENFLEGVWLRGREGEMMVGPTKKFSLKWRENLVREIL